MIKRIAAVAVSIGHWLIVAALIVACAFLLTWLLEIVDTGFQWALSAIKAGGKKECL